MTTHAQAYEYAHEGFALEFNYEPELPVLQCLCGVGYLESRYGDAWKGAGVGSNNIGCIQKKRPPCDDSSFLYTDTHPKPDGTSEAYSVCFWKHPTAGEGWRKLANVMYVKRPSVLAAAERGDLYGVSAAMRATGYYEGFGKTQADRIANHHKALSGSVRAASNTLGYPMPTGKPTVVEKAKGVVLSLFPVTMPTIKRGSRGEAVKDWQRVIGVAADGAFGPITERETVEWQRSHKDAAGFDLLPDGIVGPKTWAAATAAMKAAA